MLDSCSLSLYLFVVLSVLWGEDFANQFLFLLTILRQHLSELSWLVLNLVCSLDYH